MSWYAAVSITSTARNGSASASKGWGVIGERWVETVRQFGRRFKTAAGRRQSLVALAVRTAKAWSQGQGAAVLAFR